MISGFTGKVKSVFGVRSLSEENPSVSSRDMEQSISMTSKVEDGFAKSVGSKMVGVVHCGRDNIDEVTRGKSTVIIQNQRRRLSKKSESIDVEIASLDQCEDDVINFGPEDTVFTIKGGLIEGQVTIKEIAEAINDCARKDNANETADIFARMGNGRRRSSVLRDKELESAAAELGDRII